MTTHAAMNELDSRAGAPPPLLPLQSSPRHRARIVGTMAIVLAGAVYLFMMDPSKAWLMPKCPLHEATGWNCPGCGTTRALHALLHADLGAALAFNPLMVLSLPLLLLMLIRHELKLWRGLPTKPVGSGLKPGVSLAIGGILCVYGVLRNLPWYPFTLLGP